MDDECLKAERERRSLDGNGFWNHEPRSPIPERGSLAVAMNSEPSNGTRRHPSPIDSQPLQKTHHTLAENDIPSMSHPDDEIALLTDQRYEGSVALDGDWYLGNILQDDTLLMAALRDHGLRPRRVAWSRPDVDWSHFKCAVFRTTWDYFDRFTEFSQWLDRAAAQTRLLNDLPLVRWNMDKHYLADLAQAGIPVVPSYFIECGTRIDIPRLLRELDWHETVIKPCVSGAARHTYRVNTANAREMEPLLNELLKNEAFLIQPFQADVLTHGEISLMVLGGRFTHAIQKLPQRGDFRVQDDHGGTVHSYEALPAEIELAERAMTACPSLPLYGRVDLIRDNNGQLAVMELELIEPELWLRFHPPAASVFAQAIAHQIHHSEQRSRGGASTDP